ncbi:MAG: hypothetical protein JO164_12695, partial [Candidatus Eremiobacteraeota bacterium]|nr:hypothetical protein [Candidatus Eremiobacteraeota bacterium]
MIASTSSLTFNNVGATYAQTFTVSQSGYTGAFVPMSSNTGVATVSVSATSNNSATITVTPVGPGSATITVTGGASQSAQVQVGVGAPPVVPTPSSLMFPGTGAPYNQNVTVSQNGFSGAYTTQIVDTG